ncbi:hypothetical protein GTW73_11970 [Streptomyces sp. SID4982]|nr:hypothetical protein [Streptomyces sp. SID4982]
MIHHLSEISSYRGVSYTDFAAGSPVPERYRGAGRRASLTCDFPNPPVRRYAHAASEWPIPYVGTRSCRHNLVSRTLPNGWPTRR